MSRSNPELDQREYEATIAQNTALSDNTDRIMNIQGIDKAANDISRNGCFTASRISELLAGGAGKSRLSYILDMALEKVGIKDGFETAATRHGTVNQYNAFDLVVKGLYKDAVWWDKYIPITKDSGASPDVLISKYFPFDVKCPYNITNFVAQKKKLPKKYYCQSQMQMMCHNAPFGYMMVYLTKPEKWGEDNWAEYNIPLERRYFIHEIAKDDQTQYEITMAVEKAVPVRDLLVEKLLAAKVIEDDLEQLNLLESGTLRGIKEAADYTKIENFIKIDDGFFYVG